MQFKFPQQRLDALKISPGVFKAMSALQAHVDSSGLERTLLDLLKVRVSQINGCAYCISMHTKDARRAGESDERMYLLDAWREAPLYSARERAALAWAEALTLIREGHAPDEVYEAAREHFSDKELIDLSAAVIAINGWNRAAIGFRATPQVAGVRIAA